MGTICFNRKDVIQKITPSGERYTLIIKKVRFCTPLLKFYYSITAFFNIVSAIPLV